jgi:Tfp pilus assembly protein FimV
LQELAKGVAEKDSRTTIEQAMAAANRLRPAGKRPRPAEKRPRLAKTRLTRAVNSPYLDLMMMTNTVLVVVEGLSLYLSWTPLRPAQSPV